MPLIQAQRVACVTNSRVINILAQMGLLYDMRPANGRPVSATLQIWLQAKAADSPTQRTGNSQDEYLNLNRV